MTSKHDLQRRLDRVQGAGTDSKGLTKAEKVHLVMKANLRRMSGEFDLRDYTREEQAVLRDVFGKEDL